MSRIYSGDMEFPRVYAGHFGATTASRLFEVLDQWHEAGARVA